MKITLIILLVMGLVVVPVFAQDGTPTTVPTEYQTLYDELENSLDTFHNDLENKWDGTPNLTTVFGAELPTVNGNRGIDLLEPTTFTATELYLDRLQEIGVGGVTIQIPYPLLKQGFSRANEYLQFYQAVGASIHQRDMKFLVEMGPPFPDPMASTSEFDLVGLTVEQYFADQHQIALTIAHDIQPDFLSISAQPETEMFLSGLTFTDDEYLEQMKTILADIDRSSGILVGGGAGNWDRPDYLKRFIEETDFDFINFHIYSVIGQDSTDFLQLVTETATHAKTYGKRILVGASWLYKTTSQEFETGLSYGELYARDYFSFWHPLDTRFIEEMASLAQYQDFVYISFFWTSYFFAYLDYEDFAPSLPRQTLTNAIRQLTQQNIRDGQLSITGQAYQAYISLQDNH